jgi:hypothetical protein
MVEKFKKTIKKEGVTVKHFCKEIGIGYGSFRTLLSQHKVPRWIKAFNFGYKLGSIRNIEVIEENND